MVRVLVILSIRSNPQAGPYRGRQRQAGDRVVCVSVFPSRNQTLDDVSKMMNQNSVTKTQ